MNPQKTASKSQKTKSGGTTSSARGSPAHRSSKNAGGTPFDEITKLEKSEAVRVNKEIEAMEKEKIEVEKAVTDKTAVAEEELKTQANEELSEFKEAECSKILAAAKKDAESDCKALEGTWKKNKDATVSNLVSDMTNSDSPILSEYGSR